MRNIQSALVMIIILSLLQVGCSDEILTRTPQSEISPEAFFKTEEDLKIYTNGFYNYLPGTGIYMDDLTSDNVKQGSVNQVVAGSRIVPTGAGEAGWTWGQLYNINFFLEKYESAELSDEIKNHYGGIGHFFRAYFYFQKVKRFGDVPWYSKPLNESSEELFKPRDSREAVIDSVLNDLEFAIEHLRDNRNVTRITKWTALALKSRVALYEGTYRKYHTRLNLQGSSNELLLTAVDAAEEIMNANQYRIFSTGNSNSDYLNLFAAEDANSTEYILTRVYDQEFNRATPLNQVFTSPTRGTPGLTKSLVDSYLMNDGSRFSSHPEYPEVPFWEEMKNRDPRLSQTVRTPGYTRIGEAEPLVPNFSNAYTGYQNIKFVTDPSNDGGSNTNDLPIFRYAEVLLNFAEAKAELGELSQQDLDRSINRLRDRAGMPHLILSGLTTDPFLDNQYSNVSNPVILEVRRERRVELVMEGFRYNDLMRWEEGDLLAETFEGMYFPSLGTFDLDNDGENDIAVVDGASNRVSGLQNIVLSSELALSEGDKGTIIVHPNLVKSFEKPKDYLYPLPIEELQLNENLEQNPGWRGQ